MSSLDEFAASAARIAAAHGGVDGYAVVVHDDRQADNPATGGQTDNPRAWSSVPCTFPTPYSPSMVDGRRVLAEDVNVWIAANATGITFKPEPGMLAVVTGSAFGSGKQFRVGSRGIQRHAGAYELHLASGGPA